MQDKNAQKTSEIDTFTFGIHDRVKSKVHFRGIKSPQCFNDVPANTQGKVVHIKRVLDKKEPNKSRTSLTIHFEVKLDDHFKTQYPNWKRMYPNEWVLVRHQVTSECITPAKS